MMTVESSVSCGRSISMCLVILACFCGCSGEPSAYVEAARVYDEFMRTPIHIEESGDEYVAETAYRHRGMSFIGLAVDLNEVADTHADRDPEGSKTARELATLCREHGELLVDLAKDLSGINDIEVIREMDKHKESIALLRRIYAERAAIGD